MLKIFGLDPDDHSQPFPDPSRALAKPNGLLAVGGSLSPERLLNAYQLGIFPWYGEDEPILWWSPDPRTVFATDAVHVSRSLKRTMRKADYAVTLDNAFTEVINQCAQPRFDGDGTWLVTDMRMAYIALHHLGHAHSAEVWRHSRLIGGLYGVAIGQVFFGESMFSVERDGSKLALVHLAQQLATWNFPILDGQVGSPHLYRMGAFDLARTNFQALLARNQHRSLQPGPWQFDIAMPDSPVHLPENDTSCLNQNRI